MAGNHLIATNDAGRTWHTATMNHNFGQLACPGTDFAGPEIDFTGDGNGWITDQGPNTLWRTTDGAIWTRRVVPGTT